MSDQPLVDVAILGHHSIQCEMLFYPATGRAAHLPPLFDIGV